MPYGSKSVVSDTNGSITDNLWDVPGVGPVPSQPMFPSGIASDLASWAAVPGQAMAPQQPQTAGQWSDVDEAIRQSNLAAQYEWAPTTAMSMVGAPGLTGGVPGLGAGVQKLQKPGRWPTYQATNAAGETQVFKDPAKAQQFASPPEVMRPDPAASPMEIPPWEDPIRAYHGSPHDFSAFDIEKIGTGQGAQMRGHGLYFGEEEKVAEDYRNTLSQDRDYPIMSGGQKVGSVPSWVAKHFQASPTGADEMIAEFQKRAKEMEAEGHWNVQGIRDIVGWLSDVKAGNAELSKPGRMYEVNIQADPEHFLDWDKPLSKQSEHVQKILRPIVEGHVEDQVRARAAWAPGEFAPKWKKPVPEPDTISGEELYQRYTVKPYHYQTREDGAVAAMQQLKKLGIPGIKYLDQGSRGVGKGTYNYVVNDDRLIDIIRKYGIAGLIAGGASNWSPDQAQAGEVVPFVKPQQTYGPGTDWDAISKKNKALATQAMLMRALGAQNVLPIKPDDK